MKIEPSGTVVERRPRFARGWHLRALTLVALAACFVAPALADEIEERRLDDYYFFVQHLDRGWVPLLDDFDRTIAAVGPDSEDSLPLRVLRDDAYLKRIDKLIATGDVSVEDEVLARLDTLARVGVASKTRDDARERSAVVWTGKGDRALAGGDNSGAYIAFEKALEFDPNYAPAKQKYVQVARDEASAKAQRMDFYGALEILERVIGKGWPEVSSAAADKQRILSTTGEVGLKLEYADKLANVRPPYTDFARATVTFTPVGGGQAPPAGKDGAKVRIPTGDYQVSIRGVGSAPPIPRRVRVVAGNQTIGVPAKLPDGMTFVSYADGRVAFLIDIHELSIQKYNEWARANGASPKTGSANHAAADISFSDAQRYARWAGKALPTLGQWTHAAFGAPNARTPRYPWGDSPGRPGTHFHAGAGLQPGPVDGCRSGASPFGVLNMAGNVWEWLADGWFIGGGYTRAKFDATVSTLNGANFQVDTLRDKVPPPSVYRALPAAEQEKYFNYPPQNVAAQTVRQVGLRCIIPLE